MGQVFILTGDRQNASILRQEMLVFTWQRAEFAEV
jgi:hypothetical protein